MYKKAIDKDRKFIFMKLGVEYNFVCFQTAGYFQRNIHFFIKFS